MLIKRLDNLDVMCSDVAAMVEFYRDTLGLPFNLSYEPGQAWAGFQAGDVVIYLIEVGSGEHAPRRPAGNGPPGLDSFAFEVDDLDAAIAELETRGVEWAGDVIDSPWYRFRGFYDPEGNLLYVTRPKIAGPGAS